jgi:hypothetical protein
MRAGVLARAAYHRAHGHQAEAATQLAWYRGFGQGAREVTRGA